MRNSKGQSERHLVTLRICQKAREIVRKMIVRGCARIDRFWDDVSQKRSSASRNWPVIRLLTGNRRLRAFISVRNRALPALGGPASLGYRVFADNVRRHFHS